MRETSDRARVYFTNDCVQTLITNEHVNNRLLAIQFNAHLLYTLNQTKLAQTSLIDHLDNGGPHKWRLNWL